MKLCEDMAVYRLPRHLLQSAPGPAYQPSSAEHLGSNRKSIFLESLAQELGPVSQVLRKLTWEDGEFKACLGHRVNSAQGALAPSGRRSTEGITQGKNLPRMCDTLVPS